MTFGFLKLKKKTKHHNPVTSCIWPLVLNPVWCEHKWFLRDGECSSLMDANRGRVSFQHRGSIHSLTFSMGFGVQVRTLAVLLSGPEWRCCEFCCKPAACIVSFQISIPSDSTVLSMLSSLYHCTHTHTHRHTPNVAKRSNRLTTSWK